MNLFEDLVQRLAANLRREGIQFDENLSKSDPVAFLADCIEFDGRRISVRPREVHFSAELKAELNLSAFGQAVENIASVARRGEDLAPFQTKRVDCFGNRDMLLSDWGIHHLHLGPLLPGESFCGRTGNLLYALFTDEQAFFIAVMDHSSFPETMLLRILDANWPLYTDQFVAHGVIEVRPVLTSDQVKMLRDAHISGMVQLRRGRVLGPIGGGLSTAGTNFQCMISAQDTASHLRNMEELILSQEDSIRTKLGIDSCTPIRLLALEPAHVVLCGEGNEDRYVRIPIRR